MPYVLSHPQAEEKYKYYSELATKLREVYYKIKRVADFLVLPFEDFTDDYFGGEYYKLYLTYAEFWHEDATLISKRYQHLAEAIMHQITFADYYRDGWKSLIGKTEWRDDE